MKVRTTLRLDKYPPSRQKTSLVNVLDMWPDIVVNNLHTTTHNPQLTQSVVRQRRQHAWLTIMKKVADGIKLINIKSIQLPDDFTDDVRVALIDDGVDITNKNITHQIYNGWTCDTGYEGDGLEGIPRPYTSSETEHGTFMASTICRICPKAKIFVFRLNVVSPPGERAHFTAKSAAEVSLVSYCTFTKTADLLLRHLKWPSNPVVSLTLSQCHGQLQGIKRTRKTSGGWRSTSGLPARQRRSCSSARPPTAEI